MRARRRLIRVEGLEKTFAGERALGPLDLAIERGSTTVLIGPSGSGKSTLLRLLVGLIAPDRGAVCFDGEALTTGRLRELRLRMGYVIQEGGLFPHLSARQNVELMARQTGQPAHAIARRVAELVETTRLPEGALERYPAQLSGGQRQRVSLMRALMLDPEWLLLDEPLGALDPMIRADLQADLRRIFQTLGKTVVLVTHDLAEAAFFADSVVLLDAGQIVQQGPLHELVRKPANDFVTRFVRAQQSPLHAMLAT